MIKALKTVFLVFSFCFVILSSISYFYACDPGFKSYIDQSLISRIPYLSDLIFSVEHYKIKIEWTLYALLVGLIVGNQVGFWGDFSKKILGGSAILFAVATIGLIVVYFWPSNTVNLAVFQFERGTKEAFLSRGKYIFDIMTMCYLVFFILISITGMNKESKENK